MITADVVKMMEKSGFGAVTASEYLNMPETGQSDYERGVADTMHFLATQFLFLDDFYEGNAERELEDAVARYMTTVLRNAPLEEMDSSCWELVPVNALLNTIHYERARVNEVL